MSHQVRPMIESPAVPRLTLAPSTTPPARRCRLVSGSGDLLDHETTALLRRRLGYASLIALLPLTFFFFLTLVKGPIGMPAFVYTVGMPIHGAVIVVIATLAALLWSPRHLSACRLRLIEVVLFGTVAAFMLWSQVWLYIDPVLLRWVDEPDQRQELLMIGSLAMSLRWFFLIVLYGVFIPNTWQRCAALVGATTAVAVLTMLIGGLSNDLLRPILLVPLLSYLTVLAAGAAIAILGSLRIHMLQESVLEARKLGQYRLHEKLGVGGMGEVYLGEHVLLRRPCAIKVIHRDMAADPTQMSRFEREVRAMATLTHWNTVEVYDYGRTDDGTFYYVMEYLPGQNLESLVSHNGPLPPARVIRLLRQVCGALREAHAIGLLHRDIKPSNIIACDRGGVHDVVKLLDFGLVQSIGLADVSPRLTTQGTILGSPQYMSPEQARGRSDLTPASDIYSVGAVAYFLLTGQSPFVRETVMELLIAHATDRVDPPRSVRPDIPADLEAVVLHCLEKEPSQRFADVGQLERALARCGVADEWTEEMAAEWWRDHGETVSVRRPTPEQQVTVETPRAPVLPV